MISLDEMMVISTIPKGVLKDTESDSYVYVKTLYDQLPSEDSDGLEEYLWEALKPELTVLKSWILKMETQDFLKELGSDKLPLVFTE